MGVEDNMEMKRYEYIVTLKNGDKMRIFFIGKHLEEIFKDYGVQFKRIWAKRKEESYHGMDQKNKE